MPQGFNGNKGMKMLHICHSSEGWNPEKCCSGNWIPAYAVMTAGGYHWAFSSTHVATNLMNIGLTELFRILRGVTKGGSTMKCRVLPYLICVAVVLSGCAMKGTTPEIMPVPSDEPELLGSGMEIPVPSTTVTRRPHQGRWAKGDCCSRATRSLCSVWMEAMDNRPRALQ